MPLRSSSCAGALAASTTSSSTSGSDTTAAAFGFARVFGTGFARLGLAGGGEDETSRARERAVDEPGTGAHLFAAAARRFLGGENVGAVELEAAAAVVVRGRLGDTTTEMSSSLLEATGLRLRLPATAAGVEETILMSLSVDDIVERVDGTEHGQRRARFAVSVRAPTSAHSKPRRARANGRTSARFVERKSCTRFSP